MNCEEIMAVLRELSPEECAFDWDNVGLLAGSFQQEVKHVFVALDADDRTMEESRAVGADMLLTHHPLLFRGVKKLDPDDFLGRRIIQLIQNNTAYYVMHTNFDATSMGWLAAGLLSLTAVRVLQKTGERNGRDLGIGAIGLLQEPMCLKALAELTKGQFGVERVKVYGDLNREVSRIAVCPGSGKSVLGDGRSAGAQVMITADLDYHEGIDSAAAGMSVIDAGHYGLEQIFVPYIGDYLRRRLPNLKVTEQKPLSPYAFV